MTHPDPFCTGRWLQPDVTGTRLFNCCGLVALPPPVREREFFIDDLLVRIHFIIVMIRWTGLAPWEEPRPVSPSPPAHLRPGKRWVSNTQFSVKEQLLHRNLQRFRGGLVFKAHILLYHSTLGLRVTVGATPFASISASTSAVPRRARM